MTNDARRLLLAVVVFILVFVVLAIAGVPFAGLIALAVAILYFVGAWGVSRRGRAR